MPFRSEPALRHEQVPRTGILLCNLGTPDEPTAPAVRRYLAQFLSDPRVVEIPRLLWLPILHGIILRVRPARSAAKYASIWTPEGSPLAVWTQRQAAALQDALTTRGQAITVLPAMRYGQPAIATQMEALRAQGVTRVLLLPAYPQYSGTTTASVFDDVYRWAEQARWVPELRFVNQYHDQAGYIAALAARVREHWAVHGQPDRLVMSFHGVPERTLHLGDPYHCQCHKTGRLLAEALGLPRERWVLTFQSRFGKAKWLEPYTEPTARELGAQGVGRIDVICPGFTADCLETLEEVAMEVRDAFMESGGREYHYIDCLNARPDWIDALADVSLQHLQGWPTSAAETAAAQTEAAARRERALAMGATQ